MAIKRNIIGQRIKEARGLKAPALSQEKLAIKLQLLGWSDCDRFMVSKIERGLRKVSDLDLKWLATALNVSADWLLKLTKDK